MDTAAAKRTVFLGERGKSRAASLFPLGLCRADAGFFGVATGLLKISQVPINQMIDPGRRGRGDNRVFHWEKWVLTEVCDF
jgi:hypothetical protein